MIREEPQFLPGVLVNRQNGWKYVHKKILEDIDYSILVILFHHPLEVTPVTHVKNALRGKQFTVIRLHPLHQQYSRRTKTNMKVTNHNITPYPFL